MVVVARSIAGDAFYLGFNSREVAVLAAALPAPRWV
jgi:hypothetical protein